ncbi:MAG: ABC transporter substrate-binding protein [Chloroflexota bacterium]
MAGAKEITWSCYALGQPRQKQWDDTIRAAEQATGVKIHVAWESADKYWDKRQADVAGNSPVVDIMVNQLDWVVPGGLQGMFADHAEYMRRDKVDPGQYYKADLDSWAWKGKQWSLLLQSGGETVFYSKAMFDAKSVKYPTKDWTMDDLLETCRKLNDPKNNVPATDIGGNTLCIHDAK